MFRAWRQRRTRRRSKKSRDEEIISRGGYQGQARDYREPTKQRAIEEHQESSSLSPSTNSGTQSSCEGGVLGAIPSYIVELLDDKKCFYFKGIKVEIIDWTHKVFVIDMVPAAVCNLLRSTVNHHCQAQQIDGKETWRTLYTYTKMDLPCCEIKKVTEVTEHLISNINQILSFVFNTSVLLHPRSWKEPHFLRYQHGSSAPKDHVGVVSHYDGSDFTWSLMLSPRDDYDHGGTYIRPLKTTLRLDQGQVLLHPGDLFHTGANITRGVRELLICFMDGWDPMTLDHSTEADDCYEYQLNVKQTYYQQ